ncbi:hypothetical protein [Roseiterribacter gracilis]|uniref:Uncharacterized protein n=1 Tax=Roseiterribacter gracilis TaxID=2812848 RepID=A0A8S8X7Y2_9PROT|nr:hypothetical protein TMPK1_21350 [Rhodospirillales bacterium TMPK1]
MRDPKHPRPIPTAHDPAMFADVPAPQDVAGNIRVTGSPRPSSLDKQNLPHGSDRKGPA